MQHPLNRALSERVLFAGLLAIFVLVRIAVIWQHRADLQEDPDAYMSIARNVAEGHGFSRGAALSPSDSTSYPPSAHRPPLYPLLLVPICQPDQQFGRAALHLGLAIVTFFALWQAGINLGLSFNQRLLANAIYTVDPLALRYLAFPMTETLCACVISLLLVTLTDRRAGGFRSLLTGLVFGICVLSRPTFWIFGFLYAPVWLFLQWRQATPSGGEASAMKTVRTAALILLGVALPVAPWVVRNAIVLHSPILMTTHGGYTLLLGNNTAFYREVVDQPWGTIWDGSRGAGQSAWIDATLEQAAAEAGLGEVELDRWFSRKAWECIRSEPVTFLRACLLKFCWFWNIGPHGPEAQQIPPILLWGVRLFYAAFWLALILGLIRIFRNLLRQFEQHQGWQVPILLVVSMTGAHLVYWSDARMRAPITPALVLIAACAWPLFNSARRNASTSQ
ncbi:hypothetical protein SH661x_001661 [Planctomicrobium sp. SH661]|uniref:hypothetical protein n=1 Tax=Planctomicrobium sp. SH661 TaxID=3448124 RepID=UPI003F5C1F34